MRAALRFLLINLALSGFLLVVIAADMRNPRLERLLWPFLITMVYSNVIGLLTWSVLPRVAPRLRGSGFLFWLQYLPLLALLGWAGGSIGYLILIWQPFARIQLDYRASMIVCCVITLAMGTILYLIEEAKAKVQATTLQLRTRELENERALKLASEAKLQSLESRIHPHFLFNTLNSISALVRQDPAKAEEMIERLAALLRFSLDRHGGVVSLGDELQVTRDYLEIEQARFGERLRYRIEVPDDLRSTLVPALSIQTLAENSVKYAVGVSRAGAEIVVSAERVGEAVWLRVQDSGPGFDSDALPAGHGLDSLRERLQSLFGAAAGLEAKRLEAGMDVGMQVEMRVPC